jgi:phage baseplate assembly protein V
MERLMKGLDKLIAPLRRRVMLMVGRAVLTVVDDGPKMQEAQVSLLEGEVRDGVEHMQAYGFTSVPLAGAEGLVTFIGGNRDHGVIVATDDRRYRPTAWEAGEVGLYDHLGKFIRLRENGDIHVSGTRLVIDGDVVITGDLVLTGDVAITGDVSIDGNLNVDGNIDATGTITP